MDSPPIKRDPKYGTRPDDLLFDTGERIKMYLYTCACGLTVERSASWLKEVRCFTCKRKAKNEYTKIFRKKHKRKDILYRICIQCGEMKAHSTPYARTCSHRCGALQRKKEGR